MRKSTTMFNLVVADFSRINWLNYFKHDMPCNNKWVFTLYRDEANMGLVLVVTNKHIRPAVLSGVLCEFASPYSLSDVICFDNFGQFWRFGLVYVFNTYSNASQRIQIICFTPEGYPIPTVSDVVVCANWAEREVWELFGVYFEEHGDLRRLLTDTAFKGHPMRRDYPMVGYLECWYSYECGLVEYCSVEFMQEYRLFEYSDAWNETKFNRPEAVCGLKSDAEACSTGGFSNNLVEDTLIRSNLPTDDNIK